MAGASNLLLTSQFVSLIPPLQHPFALLRSCAIKIAWQLHEKLLWMEGIQSVPWKQSCWAELEGNSTSVSRGGERSLAERSGPGVTLRWEVVSGSSWDPRRTPGQILVPVSPCGLQTALPTAQRFVRWAVLCERKRVRFRVGRNTAWRLREQTCAQQ